MGLRLPGQVQVAGIIDQAEAELLIEAGADMLGFPLGLRDGREDLGVDEAAAIIGATSDRATAVCITYLDTARAISDLCARLGARWVQFHGPVERSEIEALKSLDPELGIIKSLIVRHGAELTGEVRKFEDLVDAFITDTFDPETGRSGATGKTHDWACSRAVVEATTRPVILAGGLTPENVADAIEAVRPAAVDAHTGVECANGRKDRQCVGDFASRARSALSKLHQGKQLTSDEAGQMI